MHAVRDWLALFFAWPAGGVWSNIIASFLWSALVWFPTILHLHRKVDRQHRELLNEHRKHRAVLRRQTANGDTADGHETP